MMRQIFLYHLFAQLTGCYTEIASCPKMSTPISLFDMGKFFKYFSRCSAFYASHDFRRRYIGRSRYQNMDMVLTHNSTQYLHLKFFTRLANKLPYSQGYISLQNLVTVFCYPYKMIFNLVLSMAAMSVFHASQYIQTASLKLPA